MVGIQLDFETTEAVDIVVHVQFLSGSCQHERNFVAAEVVEAGIDLVEKFKIDMIFKLKFNLDSYFVNKLSWQMLNKKVSENSLLSKVIMYEFNNKIVWKIVSLIILLTRSIFILNRF